ncbi:MAG: glycosyltransferase, partial [Oscillospiraceae bacterium]
PYENVSRAAGETKWSFWKLLKYSLDGITAFSTAPLMLSSVLGVVSCCVAFLTMLVVVVKTIVWGDPVAGFPTLIAVMLLVGGLLMLFIGILGQYMAKTYMETKHRPLYIVRETEKGRE